jgi:hypothetical protein
LTFNRLHGIISQKSSPCYLFYAGFLVGLFFDPEDGDSVSSLSLDYTALYPRIQNSSDQILVRFEVLMGMILKITIFTGDCY